MHLSGYLFVEYYVLMISKINYYVSIEIHNEFAIT